MNIKEELRRGISCDSISDATTVSQKVVCLAAHPGRIAVFPLVRWFEARYQGRYRFAHLVFSFDLVLLGIALGLGLIALAFFLWKPVAFEDKIAFDANVAPLEVVSGASSTLVIRYQNGSDEELRDVRLSFAFPDNFLLQEGDRSMDVGTIPAGGTGSVRLRGVMFGEVGGAQRFRSLMTFSHGADNEVGSKFAWYEFYPVRSTLELSLTLPDEMMASQPVEGTLVYRNSGDIDFPEIVVEPEWPEGFALISSDSPLTNGAFHLSTITAGTEGSIGFSGTLGATAETVTFAFHPSFVFGEKTYLQETLVNEAKIIPLPLQISHGVDADSVRPGGSARVTVTYANAGDEPIMDVRLGIESTSPFAKSNSVFAFPDAYPELARVEPGQGGTVIIDFPLYASIAQSATSVYENIPFTTRAVGTFDMNGTNDAATRDDQITRTMTSPVALDAFARYATPSGDQIGRGPLPPMVGETTKYWVFLNLRGTTNELTNVRIEGELGANVSFTGRQTVSTDEGVAYDPATNEIVWSTDSVSPTFSPSSKVVGVAFELAITPTEDQAGTTPTLLGFVRVTATDAATGAFVSAGGATITTNLPNDALAAGNATVE